MVSGRRGFAVRSIPLNRTPLEGPASAFEAEALEPPTAAGWTAIVRARAVFCFFFSLPLSAGMSSFLRLEDMLRITEYVFRV